MNRPMPVALLLLRLGLTALIALVVMVELNYRLVEVPLRANGAQIADRLAKRGTS